jgi:orotate phosphoribosyltransferase
MPITPDNRARLIEIVKARSFQSGVEIKLASGRTSNFYINMKPTVLDAEGGFLTATLILDKLRGIDACWIGGLELGAVPVAAAVAAVSARGERPLNAFFVRKQAKEHGTQSLIEGLTRGESLKSQRAVIVEDVTTTGGSAMKAVEAVRNEGGHIACVVTIVDREEGAIDTFQSAGVPFLSVLTLSDLRA